MTSVSAALTNIRMSGPAKTQTMSETKAEKAALIAVALRKPSRTLSFFPAP